MKTTLKQGRLLRYLPVFLILAGLLYWAFVATSQTAKAGPPYQIMYSYNSNHVPAQPLEDAIITGDAYVFVEDPDPQAITETWFMKGGWVSARDTSRDATRLSFDWFDDPSKVVPFSNFGWAGEKSFRAMPWGSGEPEIITTFKVPYGAIYDEHTHGGMQTTAFFQHGDTYRIAGNEGSWPNTDGRIRRLKIDTHTTEIIDDPVDWGGAELIHDMKEGYLSDRIIAAGSYSEATLVKPFLLGTHTWHGDNWPSYYWERKEAWGGGATGEGEVLALVVGMDDINDPGPDNSNVEERAWYVGYTGDGADPYWEVDKLDTRNGNRIGTGLWGSQAQNGVSNPISGKANAITKDFDYIYVGGYVEVAGQPYWRLEKRNRDDGALVAETELTPVSGSPVNGEIRTLEVQFTQGTDAIWAGGWEDRGFGPEWRFQKFNTNLNPVAGVSRTWNEGTITDIELSGISHVYIGGETGPAGNKRWRIEAFDRNGNQKGVNGLGENEAVLLDEDISPADDVLSLLAFPYVVGYDKSTWGTTIKQVKPSARDVGTSYCSYPSTPSDPTKVKRYIIDHTGRGGFNAHGNGDNMDDAANPENRIGGIETIVPIDWVTTDENGSVSSIPAGKYDVIQLASDGGHPYHMETYEQPQEHEAFSTYFFGAAGTDFAKTAIADDVPDDWIYKDSVQTGLLIPFETLSTTVVSPVYELDNGGSTPGTNDWHWTSKGTLDLPPWTYRDGGSVSPGCTVLDRYPQCNDGIDNDGDGFVDWDGGGVGAPDPNCGGNPDHDDEGGGSCSLVQGTDRAAGEYEYVIPIGGGLGTPVEEIGPIDIGYDIPADLYEVTLQSYDEYPGRAGDNQTLERWKAEFRHSSNPGVEIDTSSTSLDLADGVDSATSVDQTNSWDSVNGPPLDFATAANQVVAKHAFPGSGESVNPVCIGLNPVPSCPFVEDVASDYYVIDFSPTSYTYGESADNVVYGGSYPKYRQIPHDADLGDGVVGSGIDAIDKNIPTGKYNITLLGYDGYLGRSAAVDSFESWNVKLNNTTLVRGATTPTTTELKDGVEFASSSDTFLGFDIPYDMDKIRAYHGNDGGAMGSVRPICAAFKKTGETENTCALKVGTNPGQYDYVVPIGGPSIHNGDVTGWVPVPSGEIPKGFYDIELQTYDAHNGADSNDQEIWYAELNNPGPQWPYNDTTGTTLDLPFDENTNHWPVNVKKEISTTTQIRAVHAGGGATTNSLIPVCAGFRTIPVPNLKLPAVGLDEPGINEWYHDTGYWHYVDIDYNLENDGGASAGPFEVSIEGHFSTTTSNKTVMKAIDSYGSFAVGSTNFTEKFNENDAVPFPAANPGVPPGDYRVEVYADWKDDVEESNEYDNFEWFEVEYLRAPIPTITLDIDPGIVRYGETADIDWTINATFPMICTIDGPGLTTTVTFNPSLPYDAATNPTQELAVDESVGSVESGSITSKSEYVLRCEEQVSGHGDITTDTAIVETTGYVQEN